MFEVVKKGARKTKSPKIVLYLDSLNRPTMYATREVQRLCGDRIGFAYDDKLNLIKVFSDINGYKYNKTISSAKIKLPLGKYIQTENKYIYKLKESL